MVQVGLYLVHHLVYICYSNITFELKRTCKAWTTSLSRRKAYSRVIIRTNISRCLLMNDKSVLALFNVSLFSPCNLQSLVKAWAYNWGNSSVLQLNCSGFYWFLEISRWRSLRLSGSLMVQNERNCVSFTPLDFNLCHWCHSHFFPISCSCWQYLGEKWIYQEKILRQSLWIENGFKKYYIKQANECRKKWIGKGWHCFRSVTCNHISYLSPFFFITPFFWSFCLSPLL